MHACSCEVNLHIYYSLVYLKIHSGPDDLNNYTVKLSTPCKMMLVYSFSARKNTWCYCILFQSVLIAKYLVLVVIFGSTKGGKYVLKSSFVYKYNFKYFNLWQVYCFPNLIISSKRHRGKLNGNSAKYLFVFISCEDTHRLERA